MRRVACTIVSAIALTLFAAAAPAGAQEANRKIVRSKPSTPVEIDGVPCAAGDVFREEGTGRLHQCRLDRDAIVRNADLKKGTTVALDPDGSIRYVFLPGTTMVGEHSCRGGGHDWMTHFHPNGELRLCWLSRDEVIHGVPWPKYQRYGMSMMSMCGLSVMESRPSPVMHRNSSAMNDLSMNSFHFQSAKIISMKRLKLIFSVLIMVIVVAGTVSAENKHECSYCHITMHADAAMLLKTSLSGLCLECHPGRTESNEHRIDIAQQHITDSSYFESDISPFLP